MVDSDGAIEVRRGSGSIRAIAETVLKWLDRASMLLAVFAGVVAVVLVGVTMVAVIWRYFFNNPIFGIEDVSTMALSVVVAGSIAYGARRGAHVSVDVISFVGGRKLTRVTDVIARVLGVAIVALAAWSILDKGQCGFDCGNFTPNLAIPHLPFYMILGAGMALYAVSLLCELVIGLASWDEFRDPNEHA